MAAVLAPVIRRETGDEDVSYYPFFQYTTAGEQLHWFPSRQMSRKRYRPGGRYTLYRDTVTGGCALRPGAMELLSAPFSLIPIGFFLLFILSLAPILLAAGLGASDPVVLGLLCALILRLMRMGERQEEPFSRIYSYCVSAILLFHVMVNVGMTVGIFPVMGIPLPFLSYGGSSLVAFTILVFIAIRLDASPRKGVMSAR